MAHDPAGSPARPALPDYGNWVSKRLIYGPGAVGLVLLGLAFFLPILLVPSAAFLLLAAYFAYARHAFAPTGGDLQRKIRDVVLAHLAWNGEGQALDIGCGNGALAIGVARTYPAARVTGIDFWGKGWEYSKSVCEENSRIEGVGPRVTFQKASASALPFEEEHFDAVVSNLVFHEVRDAADKRALIREALRVLKKGRPFAFQDLFLLTRTYGDIEDLVKTIQGWGIRKVEFAPTRDLAFLPRAMKLPFMIGTMGILFGEK